MVFLGDSIYSNIRVVKKIMSINFEDLIYIKLIQSQVIKCSNQEIKNKLSKFSAGDKWELLDNKLNPFEKKDYQYLQNKIKESEEMMEIDPDNPNWQEQFEDVSKKIFQYEKRIVMGYDLNKNINNVPSYDVREYNEDTYSDMYDLNIGKYEQNQINSQEKISFTDDERSSLRSYFGFDSALINSDLNHNYKKDLISGKSYWSLLSKSERKATHELNKERIKNIDNAMNKSKGLVANTILYHGVKDSGIVDIHTRVGDHVDLKSYISTSYNQKVGEGYSSMDDLYVRFLAPTGTKGIVSNDFSKGRLSNYVEEHEYLLDRHNQGTVVNIDYDIGEVTILLE